MAVLDFKEVPAANLPTGEQDQFEKFAREFLKFLGYKTASEPNRGPDGGKDFIVEERRTGVGGETTVRWLVSCKHFAHSGDSVKPSDEENIRDRVEAHGCAGFIGFYSTIQSSGLAERLKGLGSKIELQVFDNEKIERELLDSAGGQLIAKRFFPMSSAKWAVDHPEPSSVFGESKPLVCDYCHKDLLLHDSRGIIVIWRTFSKENDNSPASVEDIYWCCKGHCDRILRVQYRNRGLVDGWEDIIDLKIPLMFIKWIMGTINELRNGVIYSDRAFDKKKDFFLSLYPYVARESTSEERDRLDGLRRIPWFLGGLGD